LHLSAFLLEHGEQFAHLMQASDDHDHKRLHKELLGVEDRSSARTAWGRLRSWDLVNQNNELDKNTVLSNHRCASGSSVLGHTPSSEASGVRSSSDNASLIYDQASANYVVLVEGESDCHTLWFHEIPALGIPGANNWRDGWISYLEGIEKIYAIIEPDQGGNTLREKLTACGVISDRLHLMELGEHKDPSALHLADPDRFKGRFEVALEDAKPWIELARAEAEAASHEAREACRELAKEPDIFVRFATVLASSGVAGEEKIAKLLYLAVTSRLLGRPVSIALKGPSSGGKSHVVERVLSFVPESAYYALTAMSERTLAYSEEPIKHRFLVI
jgi:hypothetical protein